MRKVTNAGLRAGARVAPVPESRPKALQKSARYPEPQKTHQLASGLHKVRQKARQLAWELHRARQKAGLLGVEFLFTELQLAEAFLQLAGTTSNAAVSRRNIENTAKALDAVGRFIETLSPDLPQRPLLARRTAELRMRLSDIGSRMAVNGGAGQPPATLATLEDPGQPRVF